MLCSGSRYRRELLERLGVAFNTWSPDIDEMPLPSEPPESVKAELDITDGRTPGQELKLGVYRPKSGGEKLPACVLVHGGGWAWFREHRK